ncbi:sigma-54-dependent transcriptional regulator [Anaerobacillus sp. MEB173]|uniref:sigma-54-dependent transcriptional regulator n=1 Tax=Anaerobacillus sp. MEB173 TaxID=3383345 RepID=UPI003F8FD43F
MNELLLVDDESKLLRIFQASLTKKGYLVSTAANGQEARRKMAESNAKVVFLDLKLPDATGLDLLQEFSALYPDKVYVIMTAYGDVENAVTAMKTGAFDYIVKPVKLNELIVVIEKAFEFLRMKEENIRLKEQLRDSESSDELLGVSSEMKEIFELVKRVSQTNASILLQGESGTGKTMIAKLLHKYSDRHNRPFVSINCAAIPEQLLESELFGHEKGSFTGAVASRKGKFEAANHGTLFLDEIGEITPAFQAKLLQAVQDKEFMRVGSDEIRNVDVRIITATNRNLKQMVDEGKFREDLYYRLNVIDIYIPPLRERSDDIPLLIGKFLERYRQKMNRSFTLSPDLTQRLMSYSWPGNVRELENVIERAVILCRGEELSVDDFPREIREMKNSFLHKPELDDEKTLPEQLEEIEKQLILKALDEGLGQPASAAKKLGISRQSLLYKMNKYFSKN